MSERRMITLTDANYGVALYVVAKHISALTIVAETTYRDGMIPDGVFRRTLVYTKGGNCLSVRETPEQIKGQIEAAAPAEKESK